MPVDIGNEVQRRRFFLDCNNCDEPAFELCCLNVSPDNTARRHSSSQPDPQIRSL